MRILILGTAGSGKTTLGHHLAQSLDLPFVELDALFWGPDWTPPDKAVFRATVKDVLNGTPDWVVDGNYRSVRDLLIDAADVVVWLDYPLWLCEWRLARRTVTRIITRERLFHGNRESAVTLVRTRFEFFRWAAREHRRLRTEISDLNLSEPSPFLIRIQRPEDLAVVDKELSDFSHSRRDTGAC